MKSLKCLVGGLLLLSCTSLMAQDRASPEMAQLAQMQQFLSLMEGYYGIVEDVHRIASDPDMSAILQLQKIEEIYKERGDRADAIKVLRDVIEQTDSPVVKNAASMMLAESLKETGRASEAVKVLRAALDANM